VNVAAARGDIEVIEVPTSELAEKLGSIRAANMVMLGAFIKVSNLVSLQLMLKNLPEILGEGKAKLIKINKEALEAGYNYIKE
jgi:2-oxoglutarate ferredoxin oxidoreductase subunit gamma